METAETIPVIDAPTIRYGGFLRRFGAAVVDTTVLLFLGWSISEMFGAGYSQIFQAASYEELLSLSQSNAGIVSTLVGIGVGVLYFVILQTYMNGATLGKKLYGLRIQKTSGEKLNYLGATVRYIGTYLSGVILYIGYIMVIFDAKKQALHDKIASTVVVRTEKSPSTILAALISIICLVVMVLFFASLVIKSISLVPKVQNSLQNNVDISSFSDKMTPEVQVLFDKSESLFVQMRQEANDPKKVRALNDENIATLKQAILIDPNNPRLWNGLGNAYTWISTDGTLEDSLAAAQKAESLEPNNPIYVNGLGDALISLKRYDEAVLELQKSVRLSDSSGITYMSLGRAYTNLKIYDKARESFAKSIEIFTRKNSEGKYDEEILTVQKWSASLPQ